MKFTLHRTKIRTATCDGTLSLGGEHVTDTTENAYYMPETGTYSIELLYNRKYARKMPTLVPPEFSVQPESFEADDPYETPKPKRTFCVLAPGNGVGNIRDGTILVGESLVPGAVIHSRDAFQKLYDRINTAQRRGKHVTLTIE